MDPSVLSTQRLSGFNTPLFDTIGLSLSSSKQSHLSKDTVLGSLLQPADTYSPFLSRPSDAVPPQSPSEWSFLSSSSEGSSGSARSTA